MNNLVLPSWVTPEMLRHFKIDGPAKISFSGGRTSALMLYLVLMAHGGTLPEDVKVLFANTGKEREATLEFVRDCAMHWGVPVVWVERAACECAIGLVHQRRMMFDEGKVELKLMLEHVEGCPAQSDEWVGYREVNYDSADRQGEPFAALIENRNYLPNPVTRFCTEELKIRVMKKWMVDHGIDHWTNVVGLRADEPKRVARMRGRRDEGRWEVALPLAEAGITSEHVEMFWAAQPFKLNLKPWEGNCDLCYLKGRAKRTRIMRDNPELAPWWIFMESIIRVPRITMPIEAKIIPHKHDETAAQPVLAIGDEYLVRVVPGKEPKAQSHPFRIDAPRYKDLFTISQQPMLDIPLDELEGEAIDDIGDCFCNAA